MTACASAFDDVSRRCRSDAARDTRGFTRRVSRELWFPGHLPHGVYETHGLLTFLPFGSSYSHTTTAAADFSRRFITVALSGTRRVSPDKSTDLRCTTAGSTPAPLGHESFAVTRSLALAGTASYPVSVRRLAGSCPPSFPRSVALTQWWVPSLRVASSREDLHLLVSAHAGRASAERPPA